MKRLLVLFSISLFAGLLHAQEDDTALMNEAEGKLKQGVSVSAILTDIKYASLHPATAFRELIKKYSKAEALSIAIDTVPGRKIKVTGTVKNEKGEPVSNALVYLYQTDARGWYAADAPHVLLNEGDMRHARLFGYVKTNNNGAFELHTIKPSGYPRSDLPAHIHVHVMADGFRNYITEFLFDDDSRLVGNIRQNSIQNHFLIAKPEKATKPFEQEFNYTLILQR